MPLVLKDAVSERRKEAQTTGQPCLPEIQPLNEVETRSTVTQVMTIQYFVD